MAFLVVLGVGLGLKPLHAQTSFGTILGTVTDTSQAAIPGVAITVTNVNTGIARHVDTDAVGSYRVDSLNPGMYTVKAEHPGFQTTEATNTQVQVAVITTTNITMQVGTVTQTVEVTAAAPLLQTAAATVGTVVNNTNVVTLPLDGRNFTELISLIPGAVPTWSATYQIAGGMNYSVSGNRFEQNNFTLDGVYDNEEMFKTYAIQPSIDAIQEFKIQTNITSAEYGQAAGANVNVAVKSGTNQIHGSLFEFWRGDKMDANDWFRNASVGQHYGNPRYVRNQFGGTMGGPVYIPHVYNGKDRSFWFFDYEGSRVRKGSSQTGYLPTAAQWQGDLRDQALLFPGDTMTTPVIFDPLTTTEVSPGKYSRTPVSCNGQVNMICPSAINPWINAYNGVFYTPYLTSQPAGTHNVLTINPSPFTQNGYQWTVRGDQKLRENLNFFARMSLADAVQDSVQSLPNLFEPLLNNFRNGVGSFTMVVNPTTVIDWRLGFNRTNLEANATDPAPGWPAFLAAHPINGTPVKDAAFPEFPTLGISGGGISGPYQETFPFIENQYQVDGAISKIKGKHTIKAGIEFLDFRSLDDGNFTSQFSFDNLATVDPQNIGSTGSALASYLLGYPTNTDQELGYTAFYERQTRWQPYLQDDIKLTRKLTVNLGIRYEYNQWGVERHDRAAQWDPETPPYSAYLFASYNNIDKLPANTRRSIRDPDFKDFAPRLGLAYQIKPKTTFRSGFGMFYTSNYMWEAQGVRAGYPFAISATNSTLITSTTTANTNLPNNIGGIGNSIQTVLSPSIEPGPGAPETNDHDLGRKDKHTYAMQWNGGIQHMLTNSLMLEVDYVGSRTVKGSTFINGNVAAPGPGNVPGQSFKPGTPQHPFLYGNNWGAVSLMDNLAYANYHSLQVKLEKRFSNGLQFLTSYTWSHYMDLGGSGFGNSVAPQNPFNMRSDYSRGLTDYRHILTFSYFYQLPFGQGQKFLSNAHGPLNQAVKGWKLTGIIHYNSGGVMNVGYPSDVANIGPRANSERPNWVGGFPRRELVATDRRLGWLNQANYAPPTQYTFGTAGRNLETTPGSGYFNPGILKDFPLQGEAKVLEVRFEFFNFLNQHSMGCIDSTYNDANFGTASCTDQGSREVQLGMKLLF